MTPGGRLSAAIDVLTKLEAERRPVADVLAEWGRAHRFAGSKDRAALAALVYDALRVRASSAWIMGDEAPRAVLLGSLREARGMDPDAIAALCSGDAHAPAALSDEERTRLASAQLEHAPAHVRGNFPAWLEDSFVASLGRDLDAEMRAMAARAPVDLRVNLLKASRETAQAALAHLHPVPTPHAPTGLRLTIGDDGRGPALVAERAYLKGLVEIQDEGSQIAALLADARGGDQVLDLCAGSGGKTLALAAQMGNRGQVYAFDREGRRLAAMFPRLERAGVRNVQVRMPKGSADPLADLSGRCDLVVVDAPCTGSGTWRRNPDAKWRVRPGALEQRVSEQDAVLARAADCVAPAGRIAYITCSLLREENEDRVTAFLSARPAFTPQAVDETCRRAGLAHLAAFASPHGPGLRLGPAATGTDGFYVCVLTRTA